MACKRASKRAASAPDLNLVTLVPRGQAQIRLGKDPGYPGSRNLAAFSSHPLYLQPVLIVWRYVVLPDFVK